MSIRLVVYGTSAYIIQIHTYIRFVYKKSKIMVNNFSFDDGYSEIINKMEYIPAHSLTNAEIIQIFKERQLDIPDVEKLSRNDLVNIFKNFAVPLDKRNITRKKFHLSSSSSESLEKMDCSSSDENILTDNNDKITRKRNQSSKVVSDTVTKMSRITLKLNVNGNTLKRSCPSEQILLLNIPPKRNKITST